MINTDQRLVFNFICPYWKDLRILRNKNLEKIKAHANLTVEKLLDVYDLIDFFF